MSNENESERADSVHVCVRIRPFVAMEIAMEATSCVRVPPEDENKLIFGKNRAFTFDHVFDTHVGQQVRVGKIFALLLK